MGRLTGLVAVLAVIGWAAPAAQAQADPPHVLVFSQTYGFHHSSIEYGNTVLAQLASATRAFTVEFSTSPADLSAEKLAQADVVLFNSTTGRLPVTQEQRDAFERWLGCGGGFMGVHASADHNYAWPLYAELVGAQFEAHPQMATDPPARILVEDPAIAGWRSAFTIQDELYRWRRDPRGTQDVNVLLSLDETSVAQPYPHRQPLAWTKTFRGAGRVYYTNLGHNESTWDLPEFRASLLAGIQWVAGVRPGDTCGTARTPSFRVDKRPSCAARPGAGVLRFGSTNLVVPLTSTLTWAVPTDDYDLAITTPAGFGGSGETQPLAPASETSTLRGLRHCELVQIDVYNHNAVSGLGLRLQLDVTP
jgi:type 1 glutamine amidotransferase